MHEPEPVRRSMLPECRGRLTAGRSLAELTWLGVGGPAEWLFQPRDVDDLTGFLRELDGNVPIFVLGAGSNLIIRDGGMPGVVIRLGRHFGQVEIDRDQVRTGASALDARVATRAAEAGLDLVFLRTIPGTVGGAARMNAGCYGKYFGDVCRQITVVTRNGHIKTLRNREIGFAYRDSAVPADSVILEAVLEGPRSDPADLAMQMESQLAYRDQTQPTGIRTAGSTFRNPSGRSSTGKADDDHGLKAWKLIEAAGMRGARHGNAGVSPKHPNFLVNLGGATATEIEALGEAVRASVFETTGIELEWELLRFGAESRKTTGTDRN